MIGQAFYPLQRHPESQQEEQPRTTEMRDLRGVDLRCEILATRIHASDPSHLCRSKLKFRPLVAVEAGSSHIFGQMPYAFHTADVFTDHVHGGNPLAVVPDARGLSDEQMQAITREFNYSETVFVFPPATKGHTRSVRIFTPNAELPFAGHPCRRSAARLCSRPLERFRWMVTRHESFSRKA
jgi:hypothetical protein